MNQLSVGILGEEISTPIYVSLQAVVPGEVRLTLVDKVMVWLEQNM